MAHPHTPAASDPPTGPRYPRERETDVPLRDGSTVHVRPVRPEDRSLLHAFVEHVSQEAIAFRFFGVPSTEWIVSWSVDVDYTRRFALVAESGDPGQVLAHAAYVAEGERRAEVAFLVADGWRGRGIATILLAHLAEIADRHGIDTFTAEVLPENHRMIEVFRESGFPIEMRASADAIHVTFPTSLTPAALSRFEARERVAAAAAVRSVLEPRSIAVIGASQRRGTVGGELIRNISEAGFRGPVFPVNVRGGRVGQSIAHRSVTEIAEPVELALIAVPAGAVSAVARECAAVGVRALVVISAGFAEASAEGMRRQRELLAICRASGMRMVGPNCLGVLNTSADVRLNATFAPHAARPGRIGFMSQSGGLGIAIIEAAARLGLGLSAFASVGNQADLSANDFLRYWQDDPATDIALLYLESFGNPRAFARIAPEFARRKPLLVVKSGRSVAGARATRSHTGALLAASEITTDALFRQAGVIRTDTLDELFAVSALLSAQPAPTGDRVAIVTNAGGPGILCADACEADGVTIPEIPAMVQASLARRLAPSAALANPIDMLATASAEDYRTTLETLIDTGACDAILAIFVPPLVTRASDVAAAIRSVAERRPAIPIAAVFMTAEGIPVELARDTVQVPGYEYPELAARAVALASRYGRWRGQPRGEVPVFSDVERDRAAATIARELEAGAGWLTAAGVEALLRSYGLPLAAARVARTAEEAAAAAAAIGFPVALKATASGLLHKSDVGGVRLDLGTATAVREAAADIAARLSSAGYAPDGLLVQAMVPRGVEMIVGVVNDRSFGPVLACGAGGTSTELMHDVAVRITPLTDLDAHELPRSLRSFPLLDGFRGAPPCDVEAVEDVILRVSAMVENHPEIVELDCNPVVVTPDGATIVDARVRVESAPPPAPRPSLAD